MGPLPLEFFAASLRARVSDRGVDCERPVFWCSFFVGSSEIHLKIFAMIPCPRARERSRKKSRGRKFSTFAVTFADRAFPFLAFHKMPVLRRKNSEGLGDNKSLFLPTHIGDKLGKHRKVSLALVLLPTPAAVSIRVDLFPPSGLVWGG